MFRFGNPLYLYGLLLIPLLVLIYFYTQHLRKKRLRAYGDPALLKSLMLDVSRFRPEVKFWLMLTAWALLVCMMARPQFGTRIDTTKRTGIEAIIAMDISNSMLSQDVVPSRLDKSKLMVSQLVDKMESDKVGLVIFAGEAFTQLPITSDYVSAKMFLDGISPGLISVQGTNIKAAIDLAAKSFTPEEGIGRAVIVITDGEDHEPGALEAARELAKRGIKLYVLGVGSPTGAPIPIPGTSEYRRDEQGQVVVTQLNEEMCRELAKAGNGVYIHVDNTNAAQRMVETELDKLAKKESEISVYSEFDEQFQAVALLALLLLILEACILDRKNPMFRNIKLFKK